MLGIQTAVQCVEGTLNAAIDLIRRELLPKHPNVDDVVPINHAYGCGVAINASEARVPFRALRNIAHHSNFGGQLMVVSLGCEKLTVDMLVGPENNTPENVVVLQEYHGFGGCIKALMDTAERKLRILNERRREALPMNDLLIGMQCGGSDAFSGVCANPSAGYAANMLIKGGATVLFSEVTEVCDGVHLIAERASPPTCTASAPRRCAGTTTTCWAATWTAAPPGNKRGSLSNIVEKAIRSITKSSMSLIVEVLSPAERPTKHGEIFAATPASGIGLQIFMTGRGTPYNLAAVPVIRVSSRNELKEQWPDIIDISACAVATGEKTIAGVGTESFDKIIACASGKDRPFAGRYGIHNDLCVFNPAPITRFHIRRHGAAHGGT